MSLEPPPGKAPAFAQLYVLDNHAIAMTVKGMQFGDKLKEDLLVSLAEMLKQENAYVRVFRQAATQDVPELQVHIHGRPGPQARSYNRRRQLRSRCSSLRSGALRCKATPATLSSANAVGDYTQGILASSFLVFFAFHVRMPFLQHVCLKPECIMNIHFHPLNMVKDFASFEKTPAALITSRSSMWPLTHCTSC